MNERLRLLLAEIVGVVISIVGGFVAAGIWRVLEPPGENARDVDSDEVR